MHLIDTLRLFPWPGSQQQILEFFFNQNDQSEAFKLSYLHNHQWTYQTLFGSFNIQTLWNVLIGASAVNVKLYSMPFPNVWRSELHHGAAFLTDNVQLTLVCSTVDETENKADTTN